MEENKVNAETTGLEEAIEQTENSVENVKEEASQLTESSLPPPDNLNWLQRIVFKNFVWTRTKSPVPYPGRRFLARFLDWSIYYVIWNYISLILIRGKIVRGLLLMYADTMAVMAIMLILEPLLLSFLGTTPGKTVMGLRIRTDEGNKLSLKDAFKRTFQVFADGMGFNILVINLLNMAWARRNCLAGKALLWEQKHSYTIESTKLWRGIVAGLAIVVLIFFGLPPIYQAAQYPLHRGDITPLQYVENVNEMLTRSGNKSGYWLDENGFWHEKDGSLLVDKDNPVPQHQMIVENGKVVGVKLNIRMTEVGRISGGIEHKALVATAFIASRRDIRMQDLSDLASKLVDVQNDYEFDIKGIKVNSQVSYSGYQTDGKYLAGVESNPDRYFENIFEAYLQD
ncbi:MAG TPA: RDD family protein [Clostridiaceae bacterium]|nr:RDD family protein [Clostridiaceae bacterium]